jgi:protein gp37
LIAMGYPTDIEWTDASWNPIRARNLKTGNIGWHCEHVTTGCEFCYAEGFNKRFGTGLPFKPGHRADIEIFLDEDMLTLPLRWKKPRRIFVCSMTDVFADFVSGEWIDKMLAVMALCLQHTFQVLTKRPERMREYFLGKECYRDVHPLDDRYDAINDAMNKLAPPHWCKRELQDYSEEGLPLPNVWLGVSCERQEEADARIPLLLQTPAAVRFISAEPLLGPIDLHDWCTRDWHPTMPPETTSCVDWVIVGGESGPHARSMHPQWARTIRDQCQAAGVPFFFKQWGAYRPADWPSSEVQEDEELRNAAVVVADQYMERVGKKAAGHLLDGREWNEFPKVQR